MPTVHERLVGVMAEPPSAFQVSSDLLNEMMDHALRDAPVEACGLVAFAGERAVKIFRGTNTFQSHTRYNMMPEQIVQVLNEIERQSWSLGAIYHSHPSSSAVPSETDLKYAYYPEALMVIISLATMPPQVRAYRVDGAVCEVAVVVTDDVSGDQQEHVVRETPSGPK